MTIQGVIFDIGGVLLRSTDEHAHQQWEAHLGLQPGELLRRVVLSEVADLATLGKVPESAVWATIASQFGLTTEQVQALKRDFHSATQLDQPLAQFLRSLRPSYKTALLSNAWSGAREVHTHKFGLTEAVDLMVLSCEVGLAKPDVRIFELTLERLGIQPSEAIYVDDVGENVQVAQSLGLLGIVFTTTDQVIAEVQTHLSSRGENSQ